MPDHISAADPMGHDKKEVQKVHERYRDDDADLELVSSDGVIFKVYVYQLREASTMFRSMIAAAPAASDGSTVKRINFTDPYLEVSRVVETLLQFIIPSYISTFPYNAVSRTIDLAAKYQCPFVGLGIRTHIRSTLNDQHEGHLRGYLALAVKLEDLHLASAIIEVMHGCRNGDIEERLAVEKADDDLEEIDKRLVKTNLHFTGYQVNGPVAKNCNVGFQGLLPPSSSRCLGNDPGLAGSVWE